MSTASSIPNWTAGREHPHVGLHLLTQETKIMLPSAFSPLQ
jgi:hypothetical protein